MFDIVPPHANQALCDFLRRMLEPEPAKRATAGDLLSDPFLRPAVGQLNKELLAGLWQTPTPVLNSLQDVMAPKSCLTEVRDQIKALEKKLDVQFKVLHEEQEDMADIMLEATNKIDNGNGILEVAADAVHRLNFLKNGSVE